MNFSRGKSLHLSTPHNTLHTHLLGMAFFGKKSPVTGKQNARKSTGLKAASTRGIINKYHQLNKKKLQLQGLKKQLKKGDGKKLEIDSEVAKIEEEMEKLGGLEVYQKASLLGQDQTRGGDSSHVLLKWLKNEGNEVEAEEKRLLEVGCLSVSNAISKSSVFETIDRIDLRSNDPLIVQQDFLKRPLPKGPEDKYHVISLSLVLNFVPVNADRGKMLQLTTQFLLPQGLLFFVLPKACVENSRYLDGELFDDIMTSLGYVKLEETTTDKLIYQLWRCHQDKAKYKKFGKNEVRSGSSRNNFCITL